MYFKWIRNLNWSNKTHLRHPREPERLNESVPIRQNSCSSLIVTSQGSVSVLLMRGRQPANTCEYAALPGVGHLSLLTSGDEGSG
ncbi:hypothetical protein PBY51_009416 [Eleginops maclovinus]|uniref:Uncharacterized protein n=1 Tax=Eleginops maclovinus TaxID=56733 RepID=A0AAN8AQC7_ELEMC|nr:hypothetical protein PBY51_009416 [Eleginops maclovinus]